MIIIQKYRYFVRKILSFAAMEIGWTEKELLKVEILYFALTKESYGWYWDDREKFNNWRVSLRNLGQKWEE